MFAWADDIAIILRVEMVSSTFRLLVDEAKKIGMTVKLSKCGIMPILPFSLKKKSNQNWENIKNQLRTQLGDYDKEIPIVYEYKYLGYIVNA